MTAEIVAVISSHLMPPVRVSLVADSRRLLVHSRRLSSAKKLPHHRTDCRGDPMDRLQAAAAENGAVPSACVRWLLNACGFTVLVLLFGWWVVGCRQGQLCRVKKLRLVPWPQIGCDFDHNYYGARHVLAGGDAYAGFPGRGPGETHQYTYPPLVLLSFTWCVLFSPQVAYAVWVGAGTAILVLAVARVGSTRRSLGLVPLPGVFLLAAVLGSFPVLFELERGNCNLLVLLMLLLALWAQQRSWSSREAFVGFCLGVATWVKLYPGILLLAILAQRRLRAALAFVLTALALAFLPGALAFYPNLQYFRYPRPRRSR